MFRDIKWCCLLEFYCIYVPCFGGVCYYMGVGVRGVKQKAHWAFVLGNEIRSTCETCIYIMADAEANLMCSVFETMKNNVAGSGLPVRCKIPRAPSHPAVLVRVITNDQLACRPRSAAWPSDHKLLRGRARRQRQKRRLRRISSRCGLMSCASLRMLRSPHGGGGG